jgi:hypothetical protein
MMQTGSVNPAVLDYQSMERAKDVKTVSFRCDYDKVARADFKKYGDYCGYAKNSDYVSYFVPPDSQSTNTFRSFIAHNAKLFLNDGINSPYKYYLYFSGMDLEKLKKGEVYDAPPTGFAVSYENDFILGFTRKELLARLFIAPTLIINSFETKGGAAARATTRGAVALSDYETTYQIPPYKFTLQMSAPDMGRFLGLPDPKNFQGYLSARQTETLNTYNGLLKGTLEKRDMNRYAAELPAYRYPYLGGNTALIKTARPLPGESFLNEYLPAYRLYQIEIFLFDKNGKPRPAKLFRFEDILRVIVSAEDFPALLYRHKQEKVMVRYVHIALPPKNDGGLPDTMGTGFIYSDMARRIHTELYIERFYDISDLSAMCVNEEQYQKRLARRGYNQEDIKVFRTYLKNTKDACTLNQTEITEHLPEIILQTVPQ